MTDKELLNIDLCARLPYIDTMVRWQDEDYHMIDIGFGRVMLVKPFMSITAGSPLITEVKPYLRPMSDMTEEEILDLYKIAYDTWYSDSSYYKNEEWITFRDSIQNNTLFFKSGIWLSDINKVIGWLNAHHFDYRGSYSKRFSD